MSWLVANMVWASAAMLVVLVLRRPFAVWFGAGPAYALWLIPALRLVVPPLPDWGFTLPPVLPADSFVLLTDEAATPLASVAGPGSWPDILLAIWLSGATLFILWHVLVYRRLVISLRDARGLGAYRGIPLLESAVVDGPLALGVLRRRIVVPADFLRRYTAEERALALAHEAVHHRRLDLWWNHGALLMLALNWFNPLAWHAFRAFRADQELACDAAVAAAAPAETRHAYARALVKSASRPGLIAACPFNHADQLKRRLQMMKFHKTSRRRMLGGAAAIGLLGGLGLAAGTTSAAVAQPSPPPAPPAARGEGERREERVIVRTIHTDSQRERSRHGSRTEDGGDRRFTVITHRDHGPYLGGAHHGPEGMPAEVHGCDGGNRQEFNEGTDGNRTRVILCTSGDRAPADRVGALERARARIAEERELSAEQRQRILATLDAQIARLRSGN